MKTLLLLPLLVTASCGADMAAEPMRDARAETELGRLLEGKVAGAARSCIGRRDAARQQVIDERTIIYQAGGGRLYRNDIPGGCPGLDRNSTMIHRSTSADICRGEIFEVRDSGSGFPRGSCTFGDFTEYRPPGR